ncbi:MAG: hypothetical protein ABIH89_10395, partial [Elusimicrobiota bacterium]
MPVIQTLDYSGKIEQAAAAHFDVFRCTVSFVKARILYPYLSAFIKAETLLDGAGRRKETTVNKTVKPVPVRKKAGRGLFGHLYYVLSTVLMSNRELFFLLMVAVFTFGTTLIRKKAYDRDYMPGRILAGIMYYTSWILKFLTPWDRYLKSRVNEFDIARVKGFRGKGTRILNEAFGMRVFFMSIEESKLY